MRRKITKEKKAKKIEVRKRIKKIRNKFNKKGGWVEIIIKKLIKNKDKFY